MKNVLMALGIGFGLVFGMLTIVMGIAWVWYINPFLGAGGLLILLSLLCSAGAYAVIKDYKENI